MGQIVSFIKGEGSKEKAIRLISDRVFERIKKESTRESLTFEDIHVATLYIYNELNKHFPGVHNDPPTKDMLRPLLEKHDLNLDGKIDSDEFFLFVKNITKDLWSVVCKNLFISLILAPGLALATKKSTEGVPTLGKAVKKIPTSAYASIASVAVILLQNIGHQPRVQ